MTFGSKLYNYYKAAYPLLWVQTFEEFRACVEIVDVFHKAEHKAKVYVWDVESGMYCKEVGKDTVTINPDLKQQKILPAISEIAKEGNNVFVLKDFHPFIGQPGITRQVRNLAPYLTAKGNMIIFVSPIIDVPVELTKDIQFLDFVLPDDEELTRHLLFIKQSAERPSTEGGIAPKFDLSEEIKLDAVTASRGMTSKESQGAFSLALAEHGKFNKEFVKTVFAEKVEKIKHNGLITYIPSDIGFDDVGGLGGIKNWVSVRAKAFSPNARAYGLRYPKGMLLAGYPGTGKTLIAKATSKQFNVPLFQLDIGGLFSSLVGSTEQNFRTVIKIIDAIGPCVILIDELEKSLNRDATKGRSDSGTSSRSFGTFITWLNDHTTPVFIVGTTNNHLALPPELVRKGRFDELFWVPLPSDAELEDIYKVLLAKYNRDPKKFDIAKLAKASSRFTGAEVEQVIQSAMFNSFADNGKDINTNILLNEVTELKPQHKINAEEWEAMEKAASGKLRSAATITINEKIEQSFRALKLDE